MLNITNKSIVVGMSLFFSSLIQSTGMATVFPETLELQNDALIFTYNSTSKNNSQQIAEAPDGWINFCIRYQEECFELDHSELNANLVRLSFTKLFTINSNINNSIKPITDNSHWGLVELWDYPVDGYGDCEDYALLKRRIFMKLGIPRSSLILAQVLNNNGENHVVLVIKTNKGDFILDNLTNEIIPWNKTSYKLVKWQSSENQNKWLSPIFESVASVPKEQSYFASVNPNS